MTYSEFFWADWYIVQTHEDATMVATNWGNFKNLLIQML